MVNFFLEKYNFIWYIPFWRWRQMHKVSYAVKIDPRVVNRVKKFCTEHGVKLGFFVENALCEQLEREELTQDLLDFKSLRPQEKEAISFEDYLKKSPR